MAAVGTASTQCEMGPVAGPGHLTARTLTSVNIPCCGLVEALINEWEASKPWSSQQQGSCCNANRLAIWHPLAEYAVCPACHWTHPQS
eukprot:923113-Amphidinium_carterae.2